MTRSAVACLLMMMFSFCSDSAYADRYGALAYSESDASYGWAVDYTTQEEANEAARYGRMRKKLRSGIGVLEHLRCFCYRK